MSRRDERRGDGRFIRNRGVAFLGTLGTHDHRQRGWRFGRRQDRWQEGEGGGGFSGLNAIKAVIRCRRWRFLRDDVDALVCHRATSSRGLHDLLPLPSFRALRFLPAIFFPPTPPPRADLNFDTRPSILVAAILFFLFFFFVKTSGLYKIFYCNSSVNCNIYTSIQRFAMMKSS